MSKSIRSGVGGNSDKTMRNTLGSLQTNVCDLVLNSGGLAIGTDKAKVLLANTIYAYIDGVLSSKATAEVVLSGTIIADKFNVYVISVNSAGTLTATMGTEGSTLAAVIFPAVASGDVVVGFVIVNPTGTGNFVGGTTELDDATVVPNAVYVNTAYPFNPNALSL